MSDLRYQGIIGDVIEASDIARDEGVSPETAFEIQRERAAIREQEYRDALAEADKIIRVDFVSRTRIEK
jgi:hypothetical protein